MSSSAPVHAPSPGDSDAWLQFIIASVPAVIWTTDSQLRFTSGFGAALAPLGLRPNQMNGHTLHEYFQTQDESFPAITAHRTALAGKRATFEQVWMGNTYASVVEPLRSGNGDVIGCIGLAYDVTERKQQLSALEQDRAWWQEWIANVPAMIYQTGGKVDGLTLHVPFISPQAREFLGHDPAAVMAEPMLLLEAIHPDDRAGYYESALASMRDHTAFEYEFRCLSKDGSVRWMLAKSFPVVSDDGEYLYHGIAVDISSLKQREARQLAANQELGEFLHQRMRDFAHTNANLKREIGERAMAETALRSHSQLMDGVLKNMPVVAFRVSSRGELQDAVGAGLKRFGEGDEYLNAYAVAMTKTAPRDAIAAALAGEQVRILVEGIFNDKPYAFDVFVAFDQEHGEGAIGVAMDMTERVLAIRELAKSEQRWHDLALTSSDFVMLLDREGYITYINRVTEGLAMDEVIGSHATKWMTSDDRDKFPERLANVVSHGASYSYETPGYSPDEKPRWYDVRFGPIREDNQITGVVMYISNITSRKLAEQASLTSEIRYRTLMDAAHDAILIVDAETGAVLEANSMAQTILGKSASQLAGLKHHRLYGSKHSTRVKQLFAQFAEVGRGVIVDAELVDWQQRLLPVETSLRWTEIDGRKLVIAIVRDVTERHRAEQALRNEERLLRELLRLQERERRLLAYDIHDGFVQDVVGAHLAMEALTHQLHSLPTDVLQQVESLKRLLRKAIDEGRRMISELRPPVIDEQGILEAIRYLINEHQQRGGAVVRFEHQVAFERLSPLLEGTIFRIVQEALNNVLHHSQAETARVEVRQNGDSLHVMIRDDGIGFTTADVPSDRFGLRGMKERARLFGGQTTISTTPGKGTEIAVELPIDMYLMDSH